MSDFTTLLRIYTKELPIPKSLVPKRKQDVDEDAPPKRPVVANRITAQAAVAKYRTAMGGGTFVCRDLAITMDMDSANAARACRMLLREKVIERIGTVETSRHKPRALYRWLTTDEQQALTLVDSHNDSTFAGLCVQ